MKVLLATLLTLSLAPKAFAEKTEDSKTIEKAEKTVKQPSKIKVDRTRPEAILCNFISNLQKEEGKEIEKEKASSKEEVAKADIKVTLQKESKNFYSGMTRMKDGKNQYLEVSARVVDYGSKNLIKMTVTEVIEGKISGQAHGDNYGRLEKGYVKMALSKREALACSLVQVKKPQSGGKPKPDLQK